MDRDRSRWHGRAMSTIVLSGSDRRARTAGEGAARRGRATSTGSSRSASTADGRSEGVARGRLRGRPPRRRGRRDTDAARRGRRCRRHDRRVALERHGVRGVADESRAAHRGRAAAAQRRARTSRSERPSASGWRSSGRRTIPASTVAILRPAIPVAEDGRGLARARALRTAAAVRPPAPTIRRRSTCTSTTWRGGGARVARRASTVRSTWRPTDGSPATRSRALAGVPRRARAGRRSSDELAWARWKLGLSSTPPGLLPYTIHPWVVANDRLKAAGWSPTPTNEEAYVAGHRPAPWATVSPQRRQELALGARRRGGGRRGSRGAVALVRRARRRDGPPLTGVSSESSRRGSLSS